MAAPGHLVRRFFGSLKPGGPPTAEVTRVHEALLPAEAALWDAMPGPDRRHSAAVARAVRIELGDRATRPVVAAALLHDAGKAASGLRTPGRVVATLVGRSRGARWQGRGGYRGRIAAYLVHDELGAALLDDAGSDPFTIAWAREHHRPRSGWTIPLELADALKAADDD